MGFSAAGHPESILTRTAALKALRGGSLLQQQRSSLMGFIQNQNLTLGFSQPEVTYWESTPQPSPAVNNTIIVLGVLTFALQLCLALLFMLRCWSFDKRVQEALKSQESVKKMSALHIYKQPTYWLCTDAVAAASSPASSAEEERYQHRADPVYGCAPPIHWDLVQ